MNNLKEYRNRSGISQAKLADYAGCARSYVAVVELGKQKLTLKMAERFAPYLGCSPRDLLGSDAIKYEGSFMESLTSLVHGSFDEFLEHHDEIDPRTWDIYWAVFGLLSEGLTDGQIKAVGAIIDSYGAGRWKE